MLEKSIEFGRSFYDFLKGPYFLLQISTFLRKDAHFGKIYSALHPSLGALSSFRRIEWDSLFADVCFATGFGGLAAFSFGERSCNSSPDRIVSAEF